jgi:tetratricopeptide (TPR) repeat protein
MRAWRLGALFVAVLVCGLADGRPSAQAPAIEPLLNRYFGGDFPGVVADIAATKDYDELLKNLEHQGVAWIDIGGPKERSRRELAVATLALEAARIAAETGDWKWIQQVRLNAPGTQHLPGILPQSYTAPAALWWKTPPKLIEWACALLRREPAPTPTERLWQLAAVATADRAGDWEFLIGSPFEDRGNVKDEFEHLSHVIKRFPNEPRFALAQAVAIEWRTWSQGFRRPRSSAGNAVEAIRALDRMSKDDAIGPEASLRLGFLRLRTNRTDEALAIFSRVEASTRDPYLVYLAHYFSGQALARKGQTAEAERAYRAALATIPRAQSATMALAALLVESNRHVEASGLVEASLAGDIPTDPWRTYEAADDRFWPELITRLHAEILNGNAVEARR